MDASLVGDYLDGIYNTVLVKDVLRRKKLADAGLVDRIARFLFDNIGNVTSLRNIAGSLSAGGAKTNGNTVEGYVDALCDYMKNGCAMEERYSDRVGRFFRYTDDRNCERICAAVKEQFY